MHLATISNEIKCFDWPLVQHINTYSPEIKSALPIRSASWASNSGWLCIVTPSGQIEILSCTDENAKMLGQIENIANANYATFQNLNKRNLAIAQNDRILLYDMKNQCTKKEFGPMPEENNRFFKLKFDSNDMHLFGATNDNKIYVYNINGTTYDSFKACNIGSITNFTINDRWNLKVAATTTTGTCIVWEPEGATNIYNESSQCSINDLVFDQSNCLLYITDDRRCVFRDHYNTATISEIDLTYVPKCMDFCCDGIGFAICASDGSVYAYDVRKLDQPVNKIPKNECGDRNIVQIAFDKYCDTNTIQKYDLLLKYANEKNVNAIASGEMQMVVDDMDASVSQQSPTIPSELNDYFVEPVQFDVVHLNNISLGDIQSVNSRSEAQIINSKIEIVKNQCPEMSSQLSAELKSFIHDVVKQEIQIVNSDLTRHVQNAVYECTRKSFLDLQMALVREFIKIEEILTKSQNSASHNQ